MTLIRMTAHHQEELPGDGATAYALLADWANLHAFLPKDDAPLPLGDIELIGDPHGVPRTRRIDVQGQKISETLLAEDSAARRIYYALEPNGLPGVTNYVATTFIDDLADGRFRATFSSTWDLDGQVMPAEQSRAMMLGVYGWLARGLSDAQSSGR